MFRNIFLLVIVLFLFASSVLFSQDEVVENKLLESIKTDETYYGNFIDRRDSKSYKTLVIGKQTWMAENLSFLPFVSPNNTASISTAVYYVYGYEGSNVKIAKLTDNYKNYGVLYNWPAARSACPVGWHIPTGKDWDELINYLGHVSSAGNKMKASGTALWKESNNNVSNSSGFNAMPGGAVTATEGGNNIQTKANFWSNEARHTNTMASKSLSYRSSWFEGTYFQINSGLSVRCLKD